MKKTKIFMIVVFSFAFTLWIILQCLSEMKMDAKVADKMPKIVDIIYSDGEYIALCEDQTVWCWGVLDEENVPQKVQNLEKITKIMHTGTAIYALSQDGYIYAWGSNEALLIEPQGGREYFFDEPLRIKDIWNVVDVDAKNGKVFAVDANGIFYAWGLNIYGYEDEWKDNKPGFPTNAEGLVKNVQSLFAGSGNYSYFIREDGSVFSIMESSIFDSDIKDFIFPKFSIKETNYDGTPVYLSDISYIDLREKTKYAMTILYELGDGIKAELLASDAYTMFLYGTDKSLWYWDSGMVKYHDCKEVIADLNAYQENYCGCFRKVDITSILKIVENEQIPKIINICSGKENVFFLTEDGQVFFSRYETEEIKDVEYYVIGSTSPTRQQSKIKTNMEIKTIVFERTDLQNIVSINSNGMYSFTAVDAEGNYYCFDMQQETFD